LSTDSSAAQSGSEYAHVSQHLSFQQLPLHLGLLGRDWFAAQVSLARMQHLGWAGTGSMHTWSCCLLAWIRRNRINAADVWLPGILHAPSPLTYTLASRARQAAEKRVSFSFLRSLACRGLLHVKIQAQLGVQSTKRLRSVSHEPGWAIYS
jgi:hypothetical protein